MKFVATFIGCALSVQSVLAAEQSLNPIRKVVTLLQSMQTKVQEEGKVEKELYDKFMCFCKTGGSDLGASISAAEDKVPAVGSQIEAAESKLAQAKADLKGAQVDRSAAKDAMAEATSLRGKEASAFAAYKADADVNVAALVKAIASVEKGVGAGFLQTNEAQVLRHLVSGKTDMLNGDRQALAAFLAQGSDYAPQSGEIVGILKQMEETMSGDLAEATSAETGSIGSYDELMAAKKKEVALLSSKVETKTKSIGEVGVAIVQMKEDLSDTQTALVEDKQFLAGLSKACSTKTAEWQERSKTRAEELVALADTVKVLNDDDALELFKKTLPGASSSLVQVQVGASSVRARALAAVRQAQSKAGREDMPGLKLLALQLVGRQGGFGKVVKMIDDMVAILKKEQQDDEHKKEFCSKQFDLAEDKKKELDRTFSDESAAIASADEGIATLAEEIAALEAGIKALDKSVAEATEQRKEENVEFKALTASDTAAKEVLQFARNRLNKFYNPKLYKLAPKVELSSEDRIYKNMGGSVTTPAPGGIADTGIAVFAQVSAHDARGKVAPSTPPETWGAYTKKGGETTGVIAMIDLLIQDLDKELTEAATDETNSQAEYETMMADSAEKRTIDTKSLTDKGSAKADMEKELMDHKMYKFVAGKSLMALGKYTAALHGECDWLIQYFDVRKQARSDDVDSLTKAKAVLSGADYSLAETKVHHFLSRH